MAIITGIAIGYSIDVHVTERKKRKQLLATMKALTELKTSDPWKNATPAERTKLIDEFTEKHIFKK